MPVKYNHINFKPPKSVAEEAERGLELREEHGRGGTKVGVARARDLANRRNLSPSTIKRMVSYFARHEVDKKGKGWKRGTDGYPSAGKIAWLLWGGDAGRSWANKIKRQMESADRKAISLRLGGNGTMLLGPETKFYLVIIPADNHPWSGEESRYWDDMVGRVDGTNELSKIMRGTLPAYADHEDYYLTTDFREAVEIVLDFFPELADKDWDSLR